MMSFDEWFDLYVNQLRSLGWKGHIDRGSAEDDFNNDKDYAQAARELFDELNS
jgi:hypothetical protein